MLHALAKHHALKAALLEQYPELVEDDQALADTLEGLSDVREAIQAVLCSALDDETLAEMLAERIKAMQARKSRFEERAEKKRAAILYAMTDLGEWKLEFPEATVSVRSVSPKVVIVDEGSIPDDFMKMKWEVDKRALAEAMKNAPVAGAQWSNGGQTLSVRKS